MRLKLTRNDLISGATALALWSVAYLFLLGDLGKWADDHWWGNRDPETGAVVRWARLCETPRISRPLHYLLTSFLQTALWGQDWINHLITALSHGLATTVLYVLLRRIGVARNASAAGAMAFLVMPWHFEVPLWNSAIATSLGTTTFLLMCLVQIEYQGGRLKGAAAWPLLVILGVMIPCWNEQPAAGIFVLPLLGMAVAPQGMPWRRRLVRALGPAAIGGIVFLAYVLALHEGAPPGTRGGLGSITPRERWWPRAGNLGVAIGRRYTFWQFGEGALKTGWGCILGSEWWRWVWVCGAAGLAGAWGLTRSRRDEIGHAHVSGVWLSLFVVGGFLGSWMPTLLVSKVGVDWRMTYFASVFLVIGAGCACSGLRRVPGRAGAVVRGCLLLAVAAGAAVSMVMLVGVQAAHARAAALDRSIGVQIPKLLPDPVPDSGFIPVRSGALAIETGSRLFDLEFRGAMEYRGSAPMLVQWAYRRRDVHAANFRRYAPQVTVILGVCEGGLRLAEQVGGTEGVAAEGGWMLPIARAVPIVIEADGTVKLVTALVLVRAGKPVRIEIPQARGRVGLEVEVDTP